MLVIIAAILAVVAVIVAIWVRGISTTTWEEIEYFEKNDETE